MLLPSPVPGDEADWVRSHLDGLFCDDVLPSPRFRGTQAAADAALQAFDVTGYARNRNDVMPVGRRGASGLSPWIRHGLLTLPTVWDAVGDGPKRDVEKFRDELLWQEYARHLYARLGSDLSDPLRYGETVGEPTGMQWDRSMACIDAVLTELETDGWLVNQTRMWMAADWSVRHHAPWRVGEDHFFSHLLDGSRAANRAGWQWTIGTGTGRPYGFSQWQVQKRAPELCRRCALRQRCPIAQWPDAEPGPSREAPAALRHDPDPGATAGPPAPQIDAEPDAVWLTAESMGDDDPALLAWPELPVVFVFDERLLRCLQLSAKRLVFLAERLAEIHLSRPVQVHCGNPADVLTRTPVAATFTPVPGWRRRAALIRPVAVHPWPWLRQPRSGSVSSFSAWSTTRST